MSTNQPCDPRFKQMISHYIDGDLEGSERQELLRHMASCEHCRATFESYRTIGTALRSLPPVNPPEQLREQIYAETVDNRYRRLRIASTRMGYSVAAVAAILAIFVVAAYLLVAGYQRSISPEVVSSLPGEDVVWPLHRPISISFNKEMDRESVEAALSISPASEKDRLSTSWDDNTLVLGESQVLKPGSSYSISIGTDARDNWGNELDRSFSLKFQTGPSVTQMETPTPEPSPTEAKPASNTPTVAPTDPPSETAVAPTEPREDSPSPTQTDPPPPTETPEDTQPPTGPDDGGQSAEDEGNQGGPEQEEPVPTSTPEPEPSPTPTNTPTPEPPTATPSPTPTDEPPTPTPEPEDTPEDEEPEPTFTATPDTIAVNEAFGSVYWGQAEVQERLGEPEMRAVETSLQELDFQHGAMLYRADLNTVFVVESIGVWSQIPSIDGEVEDPEAGPEDGTWEPGGTIGLVWNSEIWIQDSLGFALNDEPSRFTSNYQEFEDGFMVLSSSGQVYVFYKDGTWELYSDPES